MSFSDPLKNIKQFVLPRDGHVADFGAGPGSYTFPAAYEVGHDGRVYAIEIQKDLLSKIKLEARDHGLSNIEIIRGNVEVLGGSKLGNDSMNAVIASNILFQVEDKEGLAREITRVLKKGGRVLLIDWKDSYGGLGPDEAHVVKEEKAIELFERAGLMSQEKIEAGDHHYGLVFKKK